MEKDGAYYRGVGKIVGWVLNGHPCMALFYGHA